MESNKRKNIYVRFISDSDVSNIFVSLDTKGSHVSHNLNQRRRKIENDYNLKCKSEEVPLSSVQNKPSSLFENGDVAGQQIFGFETPKRRGAMANKVCDSASKTPRTHLQDKVQGGKSSVQAPSSSSRKSFSRIKCCVQSSPVSVKVLGENGKLSYSSQTDSPYRKNQGAPKIVKKLLYSTDNAGKEDSVCPQTPYNLRQRFKKKLAAAASEDTLYSDESETDFSGCESNWESKSEGSSSESQSESEEEALTQQVVVSKKSSSFAPSQGKNIKLSFVPAAEEYFQSHASKKIHTSNHTLGKLRHNLPQEKLQKLLSGTVSKHGKQLEKLQNNAISLFAKWHFMLREGFNVLLYGVGSKHKLLDTFHQQISEPSVVVNGFFPSLTIQEIVSSIADDVLGLQALSADLLETVDCIRNAFSQHPNARLFLVVHNIDGVMLRNDKVQEVLAYLSSTPNIHLIASIDHISAPLMWDQNILSLFNFSWWDTTSFQSYVSETAFESSLLVQQSGNLALSSLQNVFQSLTKNAKSIFLLMSEYQKEHKDITNYSGMPFKKLYTLCRESLLVSSDLALRSQLTEFLDHRLVKSRRGHDGSELLTIPIDSTILDQFVAEQSV